ncbi:MAG: zinc ribbon domain-containing protein [Desulfobacterales bacterium]
MPIFEFSCRKCRHEFETLFLSSDDPKPVCPKCKSTSVEKLISAGAVRPHGIPTGSGGFDQPACVPSGGG